MNNTTDWLQKKLQRRWKPIRDDDAFSQEVYKFFQRKLFLYHFNSGRGIIYLKLTGFQVFQRLLIMRYSKHWIWILITIHVNTETIRVHAFTGSRHYRRFGGGSALDVRNLPPFAIMTGRVSAHGCCIMSRSRRLICKLYARITRTW